MRPMHPTTPVERGVQLGAGTTVWDNLHIRAPARIGDECIIGEKASIAHGVHIGERVKVNAFADICTGVTVEDRVMMSTGTVFTNDRFPRATAPDLSALRGSGPDDHSGPTRVCEEATLGARSVIGCNLIVGRWSMVGTGAVVTRSVPDFHLAVGQPARSVACVCRCGQPFLRVSPRMPPDTDAASCPVCRMRYAVRDGAVTDLDTPQGSAPLAARREGR